MLDCTNWNVTGSASRNGNDAPEPTVELYDRSTTLIFYAALVD
jgi:hypothetical protein